MPFSDEAILRASVIFDVVAIPIETPLIQAARARKKKLVTGLEVVTLQAVEQFVLSTGVRPEPALIREAAEFARSS